MTSLRQKLTRARELLISSKYVQALPLYEKLTRLRPGDAIIWFEYANVAAGLRNRGLADQAWGRAMALAPRNSELLLQIGHQHQALRIPAEARRCFAEAAAADPHAINPRISLAVLSQQNHLLPAARNAIEECLAIDSRDDQARYFSAVLDRRENKLEQAESRLRDLIASGPRHPYVRYACRYELAQICDRTGRFDEAMSLLSEAKQIVSSLTDIRPLLREYDAEMDAVLRFTRSFPKTILRTWAGQYPESLRERIPPLAFLGGHPRSGTTLLEQVLDAHPGVTALDEPTAFMDLLQPEYHQLNELSVSRINTLRRLYTSALLEEVGPAAQGKLLLDKNPSSTARLPLWLRVFPELRVLIALRDPRDVVLSCYFQNILLNRTNVNFLSLERIAKHYAGLMDIWLTVREWEGFSWLEIRYEDLVAGLEKEGRRVTEFLGLSWHEDQARFYEKSQAKQLYSPTYQDVTRPVYARSVGRWRAYEKHLAPILPALQLYCQE